MLHDALRRWVVILAALEVATVVATPCDLTPSLCQEISNYIVILDAGSTGTRAHVYYYPKRQLVPKHLPLIVTGPVTIPKQLGYHDVSPGISAFTYDKSGLHTYFDPLFYESSRIIRRHNKHVRLKHIPLYLGATAGMRQLREEDGVEIMDTISEVLGGPLCPFGFRRKEQARILSGEEEGSFAWLSVNALQGNVTPSPKHTLGVLDIGGGSAQMAFVPMETSILANFFPMHFGGPIGGPIHLYSHSLLRFGKVAAFQRSAELLLSRAKSQVIHHPCMPAGEVWHVNFDEFGVSTSDPKPERSSGAVEMRGGSNVSACLALASELLPLAPCFQPPCSLLGIYQPKLKDSRFALIGGYASAFKDVHAEHGQPLLRALLAWLERNCNRPLNQLPVGVNVLQCWQRTWALTLLTSGYGFDMDTMALQIPYPKPDWTLGQAIYEINFFPYEVEYITPRLLELERWFPAGVPSSMATYLSLVAGLVGFLAGMGALAVAQRLLPRPRSPQVGDPLLG